jgi:hypothetical protein
MVQVIKAVLKLFPYADNFSIRQPLKIFPPKISENICQYMNSAAFQLLLKAKPHAYLEQNKCYELLKEFSLRTKATKSVLFTNQQTA